MRKSYQIPRRTFLRGMGAMIALPYLDIMADSETVKKAPSGAPLRLAVLFKGCGVNPKSWDITAKNERQFNLSPILSPLEQNKKDILVLSGINSHPKANGGHPSATVAFMSGLPRKSRFIQHQSFDQVVADAIGHETPVKSLVMRGDHYLDPQDPSENFISFDKTGQPVDVEENPDFVFNRLFRSFTNKDFRKKTGSILDDVKGSFSAVNRRASKQDREILDQYLTSIREVEKDIQKFSSQSTNAMRESRMRRIPEISGDTNTLPGRTKAMLDLIALAFWTDTTRVASMMMAHTESRSIYDFLGVNDELHYLSHFARNTKAIPGYDKINTWYSSQLNYFINRLKVFKDTKGSTVFDNSLIVYGSGIKHGDYHSVTDLPLVVSGGAGGQLKLGRYVKYDHESNSNFLLSMINLMGVKKDQFNLSTKPLKGLTDYARFKTKAVNDGSWKILKKNGNVIEVKALLKSEFSDQNPNLYVLYLSNKEKIEVRVGFANINSTRFDSFAGGVIKVKAECTENNGKIVIKKIISCERAQ